MKLKNTITLLLILGIWSKSISQSELSSKAYADSQSFFNDGRDALDERRYQDAEASFTKSISLNDNLADNYSGRATAYLKLKKFLLAEIDIVKAISLSKEQSDYHYLAGNIYYKLKNLPKAIQNYTLAVKYNATSKVPIDLFNCHYNRGNSFLSTKQRNKAISDFTKAIELNPEFAYAYHNRGIAYKQLKEKEKACKDFSQAKSLGSNISDKYLDTYCQ